MKPETYFGAAMVILSEADHPMTSRELTEAVLRQGLIRPTGKTPQATMVARLYRELSKNPDTALVRLAEEGPTRARRGTVRWALRDQASHHGGQQDLT